MRSAGVGVGEVQNVRGFSKQDLKAAWPPRDFPPSGPASLPRLCYLPDALPVTPSYRLGVRQCVSLGFSPRTRALPAIPARPLVALVATTRQDLAEGEAWIDLWRRDSITFNVEGRGQKTGYTPLGGTERIQPEFWIRGSERKGEAPVAAALVAPTALPLWPGEWDLFCRGLAQRGRQVEVGHGGGVHPTPISHQCLRPYPLLPYKPPAQGNTGNSPLPQRPGRGINTDSRSRRRLLVSHASLNPKRDLNDQEEEDLL